MAETASNKVVNLRDYDRSASLSPAENLALLHACRDRVADGANAAFRERTKLARDKLFESADRATSMAQRNVYFAALGILEKQVDTLLQDFRLNFKRAFDRIVSGRMEPTTDRGSGISELSLVEDNQFEEDLSVNKLATRMRYNCAEQLTAIDRRLAVLFKSGEFKDDKNPIGPRAVLTAFLAASENLANDASVRIALLQEFDRQIAPAMPLVYQEVNRQLIDRGVLPKIPVSASTPAHADAGLATAGIPGAPPAGDEGETEFLALLQSLLAARGISVDGMSDTGALLRQAAQGPRNRPFVQALTRLQRESVEALAPAPISGGESGVAYSNMLHGLRGSQLMANAAPLDAMTLDIVAMLFDLIFEDAEVPDALKAQIGRLQIPVLKVAMLDPGFFSNKKHPVRRLLNVLGDAAVGWTRGEDARLFDKIGEVVENILDRFEDDFGVFSEQLDAFEAFLAEEETRASDNAETITRHLERKEREALAKVVAEDRVRGRTEGGKHEPLIVEFLEKLWTPVLIRAYVEHGEESEAWTGALTTADDLLWSLGPKTGVGERMRLVRLLPDLLARLRAGLDLIGMEEADKDAFFEKLVYLHAHAVRSGLGPVGPAPKVEMKFPVVAAVAPEPEGPIEGLTVDEAPAGPDADEIVVAAAAPEAMPELDASAAAPEAAAPQPDATELPIGAWVEFRQSNGEIRTLRLKWSSRMRGIYLFTNRQGLDALSISQTRLNARLATGEARVISGEQNLIERAVGGLMRALGRSPA